MKSKTPNFLNFSDIECSVGNWFEIDVPTFYAALPCHFRQAPSTLLLINWRKTFYMTRGLGNVHNCNGLQAGSDSRKHHCSYGLSDPLVQDVAESLDKPFELHRAKIPCEGLRGIFNPRCF